MLINGKQVRDGSITDAKLVTPGGRPTKDNDAMAASTTSADGQVATATAMAHASKGAVKVDVNGAGQTLGDASKLKDCYFSTDSGVTALSDVDVPSGALLYWNGSIAGFELAAATDKVSFIYNA